MTKPWVSRTISFGGLFAFWSGLLMAVHLYPSEYDWRYMTMSNLVYPERNPAGHFWASAGIVLCGLSGLYWARILARRAVQAGEGGSSAVIAMLRLGFFSMVCCALLPERLWPMPKGHEFLALSAFLCLCAAIVLHTFRTVEHYLARRMGTSAKAARRYAGLAAALPLTPLLLASLAQTYVSRMRPELPWVGLAWRDIRVPLYLSFAFWEWATCAALTTSLVILFCMTRES